MDRLGGPVLRGSSCCHSQPVESSPVTCPFRRKRSWRSVLHRSSGRVYVRGAITEGDAVVLTGLHRLAPGQVVRTAEEGS